MSIIKIDLNTPIYDGKPVTFKSPDDCSKVTKLKVRYPIEYSQGSFVPFKEDTFQLADAHGNNVGGINLFKSGVLVTVILDTSSHRAYVQNANTNKYLENRFRNKNILDNWYFLDPVNQRGLDLYKGSGFNIDRWKVRSEDAECQVRVASDTGLYISPINNREVFFIQDIGSALSFLGKRLTVSVLTSDGQLFTKNGLLPSELPVKDLTYATVDMLSTQHSYAYIQISASGVLSFVIQVIPYGLTQIAAVKLEIGSEQTLAYQDSEGKWVLNDHFNKETELLKCIQSTADSSDTYANKVIYHTGNKPTAHDVGAVSKSGDTMTGALYVPYVVINKGNGIIALTGNPAEDGLTNEYALHSNAKHFWIHPVVDGEYQKCPLYITPDGTVWKELEEESRAQYLHTGNSNMTRLVSTETTPTVNNEINWQYE